MSKRILARQAISALLCAEKTPTEVPPDLGVAWGTIYNVHKRMESSPAGKEVNLGGCLWPKNSKSHDSMHQGRRKAEDPRRPHKVPEESGQRSGTKT